MSTPTFATPPAPGSDNVSPVTASQDPAAHLTHAGLQAGTGLPTVGDSFASAYVTKAYELLARQPLRDALIFDQFATVRLSGQTHRGAVVQVSLVPDLSDDPAEALLQEDYDVLPTPLKSRVGETRLKEYGKVITSTEMVHATSMIPVDPVAAERLGRNAGATLDRLAFAALTGPAVLSAAPTAASSLTKPEEVPNVAGKPTETLLAVSEAFQGSNVAPFAGGYYGAIISPAMATAIRKEAAAVGWRYWQAENGMAPNGEIGTGGISTYEGFRFFVSNRVTDDAIFFGQDALLKTFPSAPGFGAYPQVVVSPVVDRLRRFASIGWKWIGGYERFVHEAVLVGKGFGA